MSSIDDFLDDEPGNDIMHPKGREAFRATEESYEPANEPVEGSSISLEDHEPRRQYALSVAERLTNVEDVNSLIKSAVIIDQWLKDGTLPGQADQAPSVSPSQPAGDVQGQGPGDHTGEGVKAVRTAETGSQDGLTWPTYDH